MNELILSITVEPLEEGGYLATSDDLQGLIAQGRTIAETIETAQDVARKLIESYVEHSDPLPARIAQAVQPDHASAHHCAQSPRDNPPRHIARHHSRGRAVCG
jgi:predicted RNase H-like HicB family nuclease